MTEENTYKEEIEATQTTGDILTITNLSKSFGDNDVLKLTILMMMLLMMF